MAAPLIRAFGGGENIAEKRDDARLFTGEIFAELQCRRRGGHGLAFVSWYRNGLSGKAFGGQVSQPKGVMRDVAKISRLHMRGSVLGWAHNQGRN